MANEDIRSRRITELEAENARLRRIIQILKDESRPLWEKELAKYPPVRETTEAEYEEMMRNHVPGSGERFLKELGLLPRNTA